MYYELYKLVETRHKKRSKSDRGGGGCLLKYCIVELFPCGYAFGGVNKNDMYALIVPLYVSASKK